LFGSLNAQEMNAILQKKKVILPTENECAPSSPTQIQQKQNNASIQQPNQSLERHILQRNIPSPPTPTPTPTTMTTTTTSQTRSISTSNNNKKTISKWSDLFEHPKSDVSNGFAIHHENVPLISTSNEIKSKTIQGLTF
jgi:hypothetical protein